MMFWLEWRRLRGRFLVLAAFFVITALFMELPTVRYAYEFTRVHLYLIWWGVALLIVPAVLGMDYYAGERDSRTETFLFSKPIPAGTLLLSKVGLRFLMTVAIAAAVCAILLLRLQRAGFQLFLDIPPYQIWSILSAIIAAQITVLAVTLMISLRAPYQSTALIVGGGVGAAVAGLTVGTQLGGLMALQAVWGAVSALAFIALAAGAAACYLLLGPEVTEGAP